MPFEMHARSFDGTRWTSTSSAATLKAPHGGSMAGLSGCAGGCGARCGCAGCQQRAVLGGLGALVPTGTGKVYGQEGFTVSGLDTAFLGARVEPVSRGQKQGVQAEIYVFGQPPLDVRGTTDKANKAFGELGMADTKVSTSTFPLQWSWAYDAKDKSWTAYVSNADAGPFARLLDRGRAYDVQFTTPVMDDIKRLPTTGTVIQVLGEFPRAMSADERARVINAFKPLRPLGADVFFALRFYSLPSSSGWLWGVLALGTLGGIAYARSKL